MIKHELHVVRFEADGRLWSEQRIMIPHEQWSPECALDAAFIERLADDYFRAMRRMTFGVFYTVQRGEVFAMRAPVVGDVLVFADKHVASDVEGARISWTVVGGAMRSRRAPEGGTISFEVVEDQSGALVTLIIRVEDYTTRLIDLFGKRLGIIVYLGTQGLSHKTLTLRFLREQAHRLADS
ncbi:MAG: hypothetical protein IAE80_00505 [Anaerolinea sp.]|nr:hypothetical protein [Anaerolinea sp.]